MGILHRKEFKNFNCSTIIIVRAIKQKAEMRLHEENVRKVDGRR